MNTKGDREFGKVRPPRGGLTFPVAMVADLFTDHEATFS